MKGWADTVFNSQRSLSQHVKIKHSSRYYSYKLLFILFIILAASFVIYNIEDFTSPYQPRVSGPNILLSDFNLPIITFVDTAGAYPGKDAEERGQAEAIAKSISVSLRIESPMISIIIGEGGSGGAIALASSNKVLMLQNAIYSVISPEGCATILWRDPKKTLEAATAMKMSSKDLLNLDIIDEIISEPTGGAHRDKDLMLDNVRNSLEKNLEFFTTMDKDEILNHRKNKFLSIGRNKGFTSQSEVSKNLSMKENLIEKLKLKLKKNNKIIYIGITIIILLIIFLINL